MNKIIHYTNLFVLMFFCLNTNAEKRKILFIGNSYTYVNDLPGTLKSLALSMGDTLEIDNNTPGGTTLSMHTTDATTLAKIALGGWDYVVLQAQSQEPSFDPTQVAADTYPYAKKLDSLIHAASPCAETIFYMTWGRKNGDASNCAAYPPICTYEGMQQRLRESYLEMSHDNHATCAPAGVAWRTVRNTYPLIELYNPDESHPIANGTYLVACTFYSTIYHKSCEGAGFISTGVLAADAANLQKVASHTVLDSLENWQQYGALPFSKYSFTNNQNQFAFTNQSLRSTQYEWNFGDGSALNTSSNPSHTYTATGTYYVTLKAMNACGKYDLFKDTVQVTSVVNSVSSNSLNNGLHIQYSNSMLQLMNTIQADQIQVYNLNGSTLKTVSLKTDLNHVALNGLAKGVYFYAIYSKKNRIATGKFEVN